MTPDLPPARSGKTTEPAAVVGISGPSGSGKSTLCNCLLKRFPQSVVLMQDWYYRDPNELDDDMNFCDPDTLHISAFVEDLTRLASGDSVLVPNMDLRTFTVSGKKLIESSKLILVEGMTIYRLPVIYPLFHLRVYLQPTLKVLVQRKLERDVQERDRKPEDAHRQLREWIIPEYMRDKKTLGQEVIRISSDSNQDKTCSEVSRMVENLLNQSI